MSYSFRAVFTADGAPVVAEVSGDVPAGVYQVSGHDDPDGSSGHTHTISVVRHDPAGRVVAGASGYRGTGES